MRRFLFKLSVFATLQFGILAYAYYQGNPRIAQSSFYHAMYDKVDYLDSIEVPRLLIIGGSSVAFGIDSETVAVDIGFRPVNLGLVSAVGLDFYLEIVREYARPGDLVLLLPEFEMLVGQENAKVKHEMMQACPHFAKHLWADWQSRKDLYDRHAMQLMRSWLIRAFRRPPPQTSDIYCRQAFNAMGDVVAHHGKVDDGQSRSRFQPLNRGHLEQTRKALVKLNRFADECRNRHIQVLFSYPPISKHRFLRSRPILNEIDEILRTESAFEVINRPDDFVYSDEEFFDTYYHLSLSGKVRRSRTLNQSLQSFLDGDPRQVKTAFRYPEEW